MYCSLDDQISGSLKYDHLDDKFDFEAFDTSGIIPGKSEELESNINLLDLASDSVDTHAFNEDTRDENHKNDKITKPASDMRSRQSLLSNIFGTVEEEEDTTAIYNNIGDSASEYPIAGVIETDVNHNTSDSLFYTTENPSDLTERQSNGNNTDSEDTKEIDVDDEADEFAELQVVREREFLSALCEPLSELPEQFTEQIVGVLADHLRIKVFMVLFIAKKCLSLFTDLFMSF